MTNKSSSLTPQFDISHFDTTSSLDKKINDMLPEEKMESKLLLQAKEILGAEYTAEEIKELTASFEYLTTHWLEEYEKNIFDNKTLKEILQSI